MRQKLGKTAGASLVSHQPANTPATDQRFAEQVNSLLAETRADADECGMGRCDLLHTIGWLVDWVDVKILLPVGISFYTFEALSYTIDVYRRKIPAERDFAGLAFLASRPGH
jgi:hypothetical protein